MKRPVERARRARRIPDQQQLHVLRRHHRVNRLVDFILDSFRFVHHHQHVLAVKTLEPFRLVRRQPQRVPVVRQLPTRIQHPASQLLHRPTVQRPYLTPQHVPYLPKRRRSAQHYPRIVCVQIPQQRHRRREILPQSVP